MSETHLNALRNALESNRWIVVSELDGDDYSISAIWVVSRPDGSTVRQIEFDGLDDMKVLPIEESYGCRIREYPSISLYFARINRSWNGLLSEFIEELNASVAAQGEN